MWCIPVILIILPLLEAWSDYFHRIANHNWHKTEFAMFVVYVAGIIGILLFGQDIEPFEIGQILVMAIGFRWFILDAFYNWLTGQDIFYVGNTSFIDKLFRNTPLGYIYMPLKVITFLAATVLALRFIVI